MRAASGAAFRAGTAAAALVIAGAAIILTLLIFGNFGSIVGLYEQLQTGALGGAALTIGQLALLPNLVIWLASWLIGPGFAIGTGSSVSPIGTDLGPLPGLPLFGVIPSGGFVFGLVGVLVPLAAGFLAAVLLRSQIAEARAKHGLGWLFLTALGMGIVAGIELGLLAWWSSGAIGPGRLHDVGPNPWLVGSIAAAEVAVAAIIGLVAGGRARR
ncbi:cell division protein PerM [Leifsonia poae]|uniref:cell division protein PerM n=1 Tax=Leifsonia poae TaxID=110933 RepID=UPI003D673656